MVCHPTKVSEPTDVTDTELVAIVGEPEKMLLVTVWVRVTVRVRVRGKRTVPETTPMISATTSSEAIVPFFMSQRVASRGVKFYS